MRSDKLVYSAHFYAYTGPKHSGATGVGVSSKQAFVRAHADKFVQETTDARYRDFSLEELHNVYYDQASFVSLDQNAHYTRPIWLSEFGVTRLSPSEADSNWFLNTVNVSICLIL